MQTPHLKTRFAPSPTGLIHFGNVRTALFNFLLADQQQGTFLLRLEDTDAVRSEQAYVEALERDLTWLGLIWQEGGEQACGEYGPYRQSLRTTIYEHYLTHLEQQDRLYPCFCTAVELEVSRKLQASSSMAPRYSGKCAHLSQAQIAQKKQQGLSHTLRFRMLAHEKITFDDLVRGPQEFASTEIGDFIIRRSDGSFAFFYVNALDDALMQVTHVMRGEDHLTNTPRQISILKALGLPVPLYGHISLIVDSQGARLSKRAGSLSMQALREIGYFPLAVVNYLARLGHHYADNHFLSMTQLSEQFAIEHLGRAPARYDPSQLDYWQSQALQQAEEAEVIAWMSAAVKETVPDAELAVFARAVRDNVLFPQDAKRWAEAIYSQPLPLSDEARQVLENASPEFFQAALACLQMDMDFKSFVEQVKEATGAKGKALFLPLRAALTGQTFGPEMPRMFPLIGFERAKHRLNLPVLLSN